MVECSQVNIVDAVGQRGVDQQVPQATDVGQLLYVVSALGVGELIDGKQAVAVSVVVVVDLGGQRSLGSALCNTQLNVNKIHYYTDDYTYGL